MPSITIGDALFTRTQQRVLALLFGKADASFYTNEILRQVAMGRGTVTRELERLSESGILLKRSQGNLVLYQANQECPIYPELLGLVRKSFGVAQQLHNGLQPLWETIELAFVYGSIAKARDSANSDLDFMIVGEGLLFGAVVELLQPVEVSLQRTINPTIYTKDQLRVRLREGNSFVTRVLAQPKLWVKGSDDELNGIENIGKQGTAEGRGP